MVLNENVKQIKWEFFIGRIKMPMLVVDSAFNIVFGNEYAHHLFAKQNFKSENIFGLIHNDEQELLSDFLFDFTDQSKVTSFDEFRLNTKSKIFAMMTVSQIPFQSKSAGFLIQFHDVTGRKNNIDQLRQLLNQKEELFSKIHYYQQEILKMVVESEEKERKMIAENIHDRLGSLMASIRLHLDYFENLSKQDQELPEDAFTNLKSKIDEAIRALRLVAHETMPVVLDLGINSALDNLFFYFKKNFGIVLQLDNKMVGERINHNLKITIYRIIQDILKLSTLAVQSRKINLQLKTNKHTVSIIAEFTKPPKNVLNSNKNTDNLEIKSIYQRVHLFRGNIKWNNKSVDKVKVLIEIPVED